ncbi:MAG: TIGR01777 family protein [Planctomycetes bacterium RBG_13_63_9]|nr:MAG: TIGR01777 family protein [Planctomycetes bacterium RBG_13_63_9]
MKVLVSGATGLIGSALVESVAQSGHQVTALVRSPALAGSGAVVWNPAAGTLDSAHVEGFDAVVHLAGESVARGRWTTRKKSRIRESRVQGTGLLSRTLARLDQPPTVLACASAIGYYGDRGEEPLDEESPPGEGFLAQVCRDWEAATQPAAEAGIRVVKLRMGVVLAAGGGALARMLPLFRRGLGGRLGSGTQYMSWITLRDVVGAAQHVLSNDTLHGAVNLVSPRAVTNREFTRSLGRVLHRPTYFAVPGGVLRILLGQMAEELLLNSTRVIPRRLTDSGYTFDDPELEPALRRILPRSCPRPPAVWG